MAGDTQQTQVYAKNEHNAGSAQGKPSNHVSQRTPKVQLTLDKISNRNSPASGKEIIYTSNQEIKVQKSKVRKVRIHEIKIQKIKIQANQNPKIQNPRNQNRKREKSKQKVKIQRNCVQKLSVRILGTLHGELSELFGTD